MPELWTEKMQANVFVFYEKIIIHLLKILLIITLYSLLKDARALHCIVVCVITGS